MLRATDADRARRSGGHSDTNSKSKNSGGSGVDVERDCCGTALRVLQRV